MKVTHVMGAALCASAFIGTPALAQSAQQRAQTEVQQSSSLLPHEAAAAITAQLLGQTLPDVLSIELARFLRDHGSAGTADSSPEMTQFAEQVVQFALGALASGGPLPVNPADLGLPGLPGNGGVPSVASIYTTYGLANTLAYLVAAYAVPDLGPWVLPHNVRIVSDYVKTKTETETLGSTFIPLVTTNVAVGQNFTVQTTLDVDTLIATALDQHTVNDLIMIQLPLSFTVGVTTTCTSITSAFLGRRCTNVRFTTSTTDNDKVLATNPRYTVAYPLNAGSFATRVEATDLFQIVYDALGTLHSQKARNVTAESPFARIPGLEFLVPGTGLADLATQAPPVNFYGAQVAETSLTEALASGVASPLLSALTGDELEVRSLPPQPSNLPLSLTGLVNGTTLDLQATLDPRLGVTAGYQAEEVRAGTLNIMILRWHNVGSETVGSLIDNLLGGTLLASVFPSLSDALASSPASLYYDVPVGEYSLSNDRVDGRQAVFANDFAFAGEPPMLTIPPRVPTVEELQELAEVVQALLGGEGDLDIPGLPETP